MNRLAYGFILIVLFGLPAGSRLAAEPVPAQIAAEGEEAPESPAEGVFDTVEARRFVLKDDSGKVRAEFGLDDDQSPRLHFYDQKGNVLAELGLAPSNGENPYLIFLDSSERERVLIAVHENRDPEIFLFDQKGNLARNN